MIPLLSSLRPLPSLHKTVHATIKGRDAAVELLLGDEQLDPNKTNHFGMSPLLEAARRRQFHALRLLLADRGTARTSHPSGWGGPIYNVSLVKSSRV